MGHPKQDFSDESLFLVCVLLAFPVCEHFCESKNHVSKNHEFYNTAWTASRASILCGPSRSQLMKKHHLKATCTLHSTQSTTYSKSSRLRARERGHIFNEFIQPHGMHSPALLRSSDHTLCWGCLQFHTTLQRMPISTSKETARSWGTRPIHKRISIVLSLWDRSSHITTFCISHLMSLIWERIVELQWDSRQNSSTRSWSGWSTR